MRLLLALFCRTALLLATTCFVYGTVVIGYTIPMIGWGVLGILLWGRYRRFQRRYGGGYAHGTARVANGMDLYANNLLGQDGLILGRTDYTARPTFGEAFRHLFTLPLSRSDTAVALMRAAFSGKKWGRNGIIRLHSYVHLLTCARTGGGKGVSVLIPNLLSYLWSCVVIDPKCELFHITSRHRRRKFKHQCVRLDPFELGGPGSDTFNPIDMIDPNSPHLIDQARDLASMLVVRTGKEHEPYWNDMAEAVLTTFIAFVAACEKTPEFRNMQTVRELVCNRNKFTAALELMRNSDACEGMLSRQATSLSWLVDRELGSVLASVQRHTNFLDSPAISRSTSSSSFDPRKLRIKRMTVYLVMPPDKLKSHAPLQRMWVGTILRAVAMGGANERNPVLFLLDEVGHIGHIQALEDAVTLLRGYGIRLWFFFQSLGQVTECLGEHAQTFLDNIGTQQFFGINAYDSAEALSKRLGDTTIANESFNSTSGRSRSYGGKDQDGRNVSTGDGVTISEMGRALARPDEITRCPEDMAWIFHENLPPIRARLLRYYDAPEFRRGGTGRSRRQGFASFLWSLCILILGTLFAAFAIDLPAPAPQHSRGVEANPYLIGPAGNSPPPSGYPGNRLRPPRRQSRY